VCAGFGLLSGHVQMWFYFAPLAAAYAATEAARRGALRSAAPRLALGAAVALGIAAIQWLPAWELFDVSGHPQERRDFVEAASAPFAAFAAQTAPRFAGTTTETLPHEHVGLAGPLAVAATLLAFRVRDRRRWFWFAALAFGAVLATGLRTDVGRLANDLPPFRWARTPGRAMAVVVI